MSLARPQFALRLPLGAAALAAAALAGLLSLSFPAPAQEVANDPVATPTRQHWSFAGVYGKFDQEQLQRGFKIYKEVCSACHRLSIPFRALQDPNGPGFSEAQVKALAASYTVDDEELDEKGVPRKRPGRPSDLFPAPDGYPSDAAAIATFGKVPPDMWLLAKARKYERPFPLFIIDALPFFEYQEVGADYIYAILHGYTKSSDPKYDAYFPSHEIAMPQPIVDGAVHYTDGTPDKLDNYAADIATFLSWAAEPTMVERKNVGFRVMIFLAVFTFAMWRVKKRIWADAH
jgi:ubiquinol-cytochrome c reductase cytochrome c1 subunit